MTQTIENPAPEADKTTRRRPKLGAEAALARAAFEAATTPETRDRLKHGKSIVAIVTVPNAAWVVPVSTHVASFTDAKRIARDGSQRTKDLPSEGNDQVLAALAEARNVVGVSQAADRYLPSVLVTSADLTIRIGPPDAAVLAQAMRNCLAGRMPKDLPTDLGAGLDFGEIAAAMRPGSKPADAVRRMQAAVKGRSGGGTSVIQLPSLEEAIFYGEARTWGLSLAADVADAKKSGDWSGVDRGACFFGEPGTGKTFLARIIAAACKLPLIEHSVADLFGSSAGFLDSVVKEQRAVFAKAAAMSPCAILWDEIEAMPNRATLSPRGRDWWLPVVDDFMMLVSSAPRNVILLGCTNLIELVDAALLRPGRMERAIEIKAAESAEGLAAILRFHLGADLAGDDLLPLAHMGLGATAAEAMEWVRRARRTARVAGRKMIIDDLTAVVAPPDDRPIEIRRRAAIHEAAHAVIALLLGEEVVRSVSVVPKRGSNGRMNVGGIPDLGMRGREHFERIVVGILAGRAAEITLYGSPSAGAGGDPNSDLAVATRLVASVHASLGLADTLLYRGDSTSLQEMLNFDPALRRTVEDEIRKLHARAAELVRENRAKIEAVADALLARRHLGADEVRRIIGLVGRRMAAEATTEAGTDMPPAEGGTR